MTRKEIDSLKEKLKANLPKRRYEHTLGVAYTSACLAYRYNSNPETAELSGLLHDCAKQYKDTELAGICIKAGIKITKEELETPQILHAMYGPYLAEKKYHITDPVILENIRWHTTGRENMTVQEKIVFVSDYIEPNRIKISNLPEIRKIAFEDLTLAVYTITKETLFYLRSKNCHIDEMTQKCFDWLEENGIHD